MKTEKTDLTLKARINLALSRHWRLATIVFAGAVVVMAGIFIFDYVSQGKIEDSAMLSEDIQDAYNEWVQTETDARDDKVLNELIEKAIKDYPRQFAAQRGYFVRGLMGLEKKSWEDASTAFLYLSDTWPESYLAPVSLYNAGAAREEIGDRDGAALIWQRLVDNYADVSPDAPEALFNLGRISEMSGDSEKALSYYRDIAARFPESRWTDLGKSRILVLEGRS